MLILGEVHTGLLQTSEALPEARARALLERVAGEGATSRSRPVAMVESAEALTGVDCYLPSASGARVRAVGTVAAGVTVVAGHVVQAGAHVCLSRGRHGRRQRWEHYLARPGAAEVLGRWRIDDVSRGFLHGSGGPEELSLEGVAGRCLDQVQQAAPLDRRPPIRAPRTRLRWVATGSSETIAPGIRVMLSAPTERSARLELPPPDLPAAGTICADLALHDWLLSVVESVVTRARIGYRPALTVVSTLRPMVEHLLHVWRPTARLPRSLTAYWEEFDRQSGAESQWSATVLRIRDALTLAAMDAAGRTAQLEGDDEQWRYPHEPVGRSAGVYWSRLP